MGVVNEKATSDKLSTLLKKIRKVCERVPVHQRARETLHFSSFTVKHQFWVELVVDHLVSHMLV
ncbi:hypothetical protein AKJ16_DCAP06866 [Drosera capensis]